MMRRLFANIDGSEEEDNYEDNDPPYTEPVNVPVAAAGGQVLQEEVRYGSTRLTNIGKDWLLEKCVKEDLFPKT